MTGVTSPLFMRLGNRARPPRQNDTPPPVGTFHDVSISNILATGAGATGCAFVGIPGHPIENISLSNIRITFAGGGTAVSAELPELEAKYPECVMFGPLPAYGFYFRHAPKCAPTGRGTGLRHLGSTSRDTR